MNTEQCLEMIKALNDTYQRIAMSGTPEKKDVYKLKHLLTEIEMVMISMKKSVATMVEKLNIYEPAPPKIKIQSKAENK